jgi:hypothetical protein
VDGRWDLKNFYLTSLRQKLLNQQANKLKIKEEKYKKLWTAIHIVQNIYEKLI